MRRKSANTESSKGEGTKKLHHTPEPHLSVQEPQNPTSEQECLAKHSKSKLGRAGKGTEVQLSPLPVVLFASQSLEYIQ